MRLPNADRATLDPAKVRDYLLSSSHPVGRFKAHFFHRLGYSSRRWEVLLADLRRHGVEGSASPGDPTPYGNKFEVRGSLVGPTGRSAGLVTVWIILTGTDIPRFVTAFPS